MKRIAARVSVGVLVALLLVAAYALWAFSPPQLARPVSAAFTLPEVVVITPLEEPRSGASLTVSEGRISFASSFDSSNGNVLDEYRGHYVLPGIIDTHTHLPNDTPLHLTEHFGQLYLLYGVTTVRDAGDASGTSVAEAKRQFERGAPGPRVLACGPPVGGHNPRFRNQLRLSDAASAPAVIDTLIAQGFDCIKLYDDLSAKQIHALVDAARARGLPAIGHVPYGLTVETAGVPNVQHLMGVMRPEDIAAGDHVAHRIFDWSSVDDARIDEVVGFAAEHGVAFTPTLVTGQQIQLLGQHARARVDARVRLLPDFFADVVWHPVDGLPFYRGLDEADLANAERAQVKRLSMVRRLHEAGVTMMLGTDTQQPYVVPGVSAQMEMRLFAEAGIPTEEVWAYATFRSARDLGIANLGRLVEGAPADLLVFESNPIADLDHLETLVAVVQDGRLYRIRDLRASAKRFQEHYAHWLIDLVSTWLSRRLVQSSVLRDY